MVLNTGCTVARMSLPFALAVATARGAGESREASRNVTLATTYTQHTGVRVGACASRHVAASRGDTGTLHPLIPATHATTAPISGVTYGCQCCGGLRAAGGGGRHTRFRTSGITSREGEDSAGARTVVEHAQGEGARGDVKNGQHEGGGEGG